MHNLLSGRKNLFKWETELSEKCDICAETEDIRHLIFDCRNVSYIWNMVSHVCKFNIKRKRVVIGFYFECNQNTNLLNNFIFFIALKIYKFKMFCRVENLQETWFSLTNNVKKYAPYFGIRQ